MTVGDISERMLRALVVQQIRAGKIDQQDILEAADELDAEGDEEAAHTMRCLIAHAAAPRTTEWLAEKRRRDIRERTAMLEKGPPDGGNSGQ